jgi:hypothetical protein
LTGLTGFSGFIFCPYRFPEESDETQSAFGRKRHILTIKHGVRFSDHVGD